VQVSGVQAAGAARTIALEGAMLRPVMADDWIDELADKVHKQDARALKDKQLRLHEAQVISEKGLGFWEDLVVVVQRDLRGFEKAFPHDSNRIMEFNQISPTCFRLSKADRPGFSCTVEIHPESAGIEFRYDRTSREKPPTSDDAPTSGWSGTLVMRVDSNDNLYLSQYGRDFRSLDEVSKLFLERVFTG
jgi:hypothetical protein